MNGKILFGMLYVLLSGCATPTPKPISHFELQTPRSFGYLIGDEIMLRIVVETRQDVHLNLDSVPAPGEINGWLTLNAATAESEDHGGKTVIELHYQVFYAAREIKMLSIPGFNLTFSQAGKILEQRVPAWRFTLSPLKDPAVRKNDSSLNLMRPDALPASLSADNLLHGLYASLVLTLSAALLLCGLYGYFPAWPKRRIFKRATSQLDSLSGQDRELALSVFHHALNTLNGYPLFKHRLPAFYRAHPEYRPLAGQMEWFFNLSNQVLFAGWDDFDTRTLHELKELCRLCREIERGSR